ncbi:MAG: translation elongation factor Ts [Bryobacteraceae bacterium]
MADINANLVKQLRDMTGAGMMDCKKALVATDGNLEEAVVYLRKQGIASAGKKESRATKQGLIASFIGPDARAGVLVEINCESDFVARTEDFQALAADVAAHIAETKPAAREILYEQNFIRDQSTTVGEFVKTKIAKLGENIAVSRFVVYEVSGTGALGNYIHPGGQIGVMVEMQAGSAEITSNAEFIKLTHDIAMQVAAAHPDFVSKEDVPHDLLEKERSIQRDRALGEGKPEKMVDKIAEGRMSKFYEEVCLLEQPFIRENTISVAELIKTAAAKLGSSINVARFSRYKVGDAMDAPGVQESPIPVTV